MRTGLVVLNYNDAERTIKLVRRAAEMPVLDAICVTDNASTDDSVPAIRQAFSGVEQVFLLESPSNGGYAAGNNLGLRYLAEEQNCDILLIANPDVIFTKESIDEICHAFERYPEYGALGPVMRNADGTISSRPYLQIPGAWQGIGLCFIRTIGFMNVSILMFFATMGMGLWKWMPFRGASGRSGEIR